MNSMKCYQCVLKHISGALSYGKQIMSGHGKGADLDHRIDYLGQIKNLEDHLQLIDSNIFLEVKNYRSQLQNKKVEVDDYDLQYLRQLYLKIQNIQNGSKPQTNIQSQINGTVNVLFMEIKDKSYFDLCYRMLKQNLTEYNKIYYLKSDIDLSGYDVQKIDYKDIDSEYLWIMNQKDIILKKISSKSIIRIKDFKSQFNFKPIVEVLKKNQPYYFYDNFPCLVSKKDFEQFIDKEYPLTYYCNKYKAQIEYNNFQVSLKLDKVLCCSNRQKITTALFCHVENQVALNSLKDYFKITNNK